MPNKRSNFMKFSPLSRYRQILAAADWRQDPHSLSPNVKQWLCHSGSLTEKMLQRCPDLQVEITQQGWQQAGKFCQIFSPNLTACHSVWLREVVISANGKPWIFAQTTLPKATIDAVAQEVLQLGDRPIGLWLFPQNPQRQSLEWRQDPQTGLYARRSNLLLHGYPLTIVELFLPDFSFAPFA